MEKTYSEFMNEITSDELYYRLLAFGMFAEKLPPIFTTEHFYNYCEKVSQPFSNKECQMLNFETIREINIPRLMAIPNPFAYQKLCRCLADNWDKIQKHFEKQTSYWKHKISRIHIRKKPDSMPLFNMSYGSELAEEETISYENSVEYSTIMAIFDMNYKNYKVDGNPETDFLIGKRWLVKADISNFFPSIYTHSLTWALIGKPQAKLKENRKGNWFNDIDEYCSNLKEGETHGLPIGPHTSNILSEIILTVIDKNLQLCDWDYVRHIDDYECYTATREEAELFLSELNTQLRSFDLFLNHKKTEIIELPITVNKNWKLQISKLDRPKKGKPLDYIDIQIYLDSAVELMQENSSNSAILNYIIKVISGHKLTENAEIYFIKTVLHFAVIYPYLVRLLDKYIFEKFKADKNLICDFSNIIYKNGINSRNYELVIYSIFFAVKYDFDICDLSADEAIKNNDCLFLLFTYLYFDKINNKKEKNY